MGFTRTFFLLPENKNLFTVVPLHTDSFPDKLVHFVQKNPSVLNTDPLENGQQALNLGPRDHIVPYPAGGYTNITNIGILSFSDTNARTCQNVSFQIGNTIQTYEWRHHSDLSNTDTSLIRTLRWVPSVSVYRDTYALHRYLLF